MSENKMYTLLGSIKICGPTSREKRCNIFVNLAALFGCEFNKEAALKLQTEWKKMAFKAKLDIDSESDFVSIYVSKSAVVELAVLINQMAIEKHALDQELIESVRNEIKKWKAPEPFQWNIGDIFYLVLSENLLAYGQVLGNFRGIAPTCVLFEYFTESPTLNISTVLNARPLAILHVSSDHLDDNKWIVIGNSKPVLNPNSGPCGERGAVGSRDWDGLEILAKAWCALKPWNQYYKENYLDEFLLSGVCRPQRVILLGRSALEALGIKRSEWK